MLAGRFQDAIKLIAFFFNYLADPAIANEPGVKFDVDGLLDVIRFYFLDSGQMPHRIFDGLLTARTMHALDLQMSRSGSHFCIHGRFVTGSHR